MEREGVEGEDEVMVIEGEKEEGMMEKGERRYIVLLFSRSCESRILHFSCPFCS